MKVSALALVAVVVLAVSLTEARPLLTTSSTGALQSVSRALRGTVDLNPIAEGVEAYTNAQIDHVNDANDINEAQLNSNLAANRQEINDSNRNNVNGNSGAVVGSVNKNLANLGLGAVRIGNGNLGNGR